MKAQPLRSTFKKAERAFFKAFNNKTPMRPTLYALAAGGMVYAGVHTLVEIPNSTPRNGDTAHATQYQQNLDLILQEAATITVVSDDSLDQRGQDLVQRLVVDANVSERDAIDIARRFLAEANQPEFSEKLRHNLRLIVNEGNHLDRYRDRSEAADATEAAREILSRLERGQDHPTTHLAGWLMYSGLMQGTVLILLKRGAKRDDELEQEERRDSFQEKIRDIRDMMAPKK